MFHIFCSVKVQTLPKRYSDPMSALPIMVRALVITLGLKGTHRQIPIPLTDATLDMSYTLNDCHYAELPIHYDSNRAINQTGMQRGCKNKINKDVHSILRQLWQNGQCQQLYALLLVQTVIACLPHAVQCPNIYAGH